MKNSAYESKDNPIFIPPSFRRIYRGARVLSVSVVVGLITIGCEGGVVDLTVPEVSTSVPALTDDPIVDTMLAGDSSTVGDEAAGAGMVDDVDTSAGDVALAAEDQLGLDGEAEQEADLPSNDIQLDDSTVEGDAGLDAVVEPDLQQALEVETVPAPAKIVGLSQQAQTILKNALSRGGVRIMPTGDSITHGVRGGASYRRELADLLDVAGCSYRMVGSQSQSISDTGYYGAHEAYSGHTADNFLSGRVSESGSNAGIASAVNYQAPDLVLLHIGSNDLYVGQTVESTIAEIATIIDTIYENKPDTVVVVANVIPWRDVTQDANLPDAIRMLGNKVQDLVRESNNPLLSLADVRTGFTEDMLQSDRVHPNLEGDIHIANAIFDSFYSASICK